MQAVERVANATRSFPSIPAWSGLLHATQVQHGVPVSCRDGIGENFVAVESWWSSDAPAAWLQAVGSLIAIGIAIGVPVYQRRASSDDARSEEARRSKEHIKRMTVALRAEVSGCVKAVERETDTAIEVLNGLAVARAQSRPIKPFGDTREIIFTEAIIYRAVAPELGAFPPRLITQIVNFYDALREIPRLATMTENLEKNLATLRELGPRLSRSGYLVLALLDSFAADDYDANSRLAIDPAAIPERYRNAPA